MPLRGHRGAHGTRMPRLLFNIMLNLIHSPYTIYAWAMLYLCTIHAPSMSLRDERDMRDERDKSMHHLCPVYSPSTPRLCPVRSPSMLYLFCIYAVSMPYPALSMPYPCPIRSPSVPRPCCIYAVSTPVYAPF